MKIRVQASLDLVGCKVETIMEVPDEELEGMSDADIDYYINAEYAQDWAMEQLDYYAEVIDE